MRVAVSSAGTQRHVLGVDEVTPMPARTQGLCKAWVDIEVTRHTQRSIRELRICHACLDLWIAHLQSVKSLVGKKADKRIAAASQKPLVRLAIRPLTALAGVFNRAHRRRGKDGKPLTDWLHRKLR